MTPREHLMRQAMADLLELPVSAISLTLDFTEQGIDSLLALRLARKLNDLCGREIDIEWLFDYPSISQLAARIDREFGSLTALPD